MEAAQVLDQPCYSLRLLQPFILVLEESGSVPEAALAQLRGLDPEARVHVSAVHAMLEAALKRTGDALIGLKASAKTMTGDVGVVDFVMSSAETPRAALMAAGRYMRLLNDTLSFTLEVDGPRATARLESSVLITDAAEDFGLCGLIRNQSPSWPEGMLESLDVWFRHAAPDDPEPYQRALGPVRLHFHAPFSGFSFPSHYLDVALRSRDRRLHEVLLRYAEGALASLPQSASVTERVRSFVVERLATGDFGLEDAARELCMSSRTLGRRLTEEGTNFKNLVDELRKTIALRYVAGHDLGLAEVALLAGFTETPSFYRAFRRWTNMTPSQYRRSHRGSVRGLR